MNPQNVPREARKARLDMPEGKPCSAELKARVALEAPQSAKIVGETAPEHGLNPSLARNREAEAEPAEARVESDRAPLPAEEQGDPFPDRVRGTGITYAPIGRTHMYLT